MHDGEDDSEAFLADKAGRNYHLEASGGMNRLAVN